MKDLTTNQLIKINEEQERLSKLFKQTEDVQEKKDILEKAEVLKRRRLFHEGVLERRKAGD